MKVFIIEWSGCECGGASRVAFDSMDKAEAWVASQMELISPGSSYLIPHDIGIDGYEIFEVELQ